MNETLSLKKIPAFPDDGRKNVIIVGGGFADQLAREDFSRSGYSVLYLIGFKNRVTVNRWRNE